ncbi:THUMP-like domain-containing protein [Aquimarina sp. 2201CG14-23]|uniref:THUMP-like domain-containing protein n=1 Tax=Aquimarina mycalae TaxID=3040073 RepID=UPI00247800D7|nr:class I SAM-dependent methyltransferase [Aquimarina sp. 2201CG14-23]MDH7446720.1 class I SAM-dependent methyltransferase [Aquimarina sp. 2201CG14-23]
MNNNILHTEIQDFIFKKSDERTDISKFILSGSPYDDITVQELAQQISGRLKAKDKLSLWHQTKGIFYPPTLNLEQTSSEATAVYKSTLVSGNTLIDLTGGFGIDDYFFSKNINQVIHCEMNEELSKIATHNFKVLDADITCICGDGLQTLKKSDTIDWIYIDPSRRHNSKGKVFFLEDCLPDVPSNLDMLFSKSNHILIKTSPLLDIHSGLKSLQFVKEIHIVAVNNEVKELLWVLEKETKKPTIAHTINLVKGKTIRFSFELLKENDSNVALSQPKKYIYEPNAAIMKSGGFYSIAKAYELQKIHEHSHLYTSNQKIEFPGRSFEVLTVLPYQRQILKKEKIIKANITTRNFPETVSEIRKKLKIKDGGDIYLFFTTNLTNEKIVLVCRKTTL